MRPFRRHLPRSSALARGTVVASLALLVTGCASTPDPAVTEAPTLENGLAGVERIVVSTDIDSMEDRLALLDRLTHVTASRGIQVLDAGEFFRGQKDPSDATIRVALERAEVDAYVRVVRSGGHHRVSARNSNPLASGTGSSLRGGTPRQSVRFHYELIVPSSEEAQASEEYLVPLRDVSRPGLLGQAIGTRLADALVEGGLPISRASR